MKSLSAPAQKLIVQMINRTVEPLPFIRPPFARTGTRSRACHQAHRALRAVHSWRTIMFSKRSNVERLSELLPGDERGPFGYDARSLDWWDYWINVHIPALRKWCYPLIEGRALESTPPTRRPACQPGSRLKPEAAASAITVAFTIHCGHIPYRKSTGYIGAHLASEHPHGLS